MRKRVNQSIIPDPQPILFFASVNLHPDDFVIVVSILCFSVGCIQNSEVALCL